MLNVKDGKESKHELDKNMWLLRDGNGNIPLECAVFGSYNSEYQKLKFDKNKNDLGIEFIELLHQIQHQTVAVKFENIV